MFKKIIIISSLLLLVPTFAFALGENEPTADFYRQPEVRIFNAGDPTPQTSFLVLPETFRGGASVAVGDVNGDQKQEIIIGAGLGGGPQVKIFNAEGQLLGFFFAYQPTLRNGVQVAAGDLDGDGIAEIITGTGYRSGPQVRVFNDHGQAKLTAGFFAYPEKFRGGVNVACGDVNGDGQDEIITGAGVGGGAQVRVFNGSGQYLGLDFFPFSHYNHGGVSVAAANVDGGAEVEIIMGVYKYGRPWVKVYKADGSGRVLGDFQAYQPEFKSGIIVAGGDIDYDGFDEIAVTPTAYGGPHVKFFEAYGQALSQYNFMAYETDFRGGVNLVLADLDQDRLTEVITAPRRTVYQGSTDYYKYVDVSISEQRLKAYEAGQLVKEMLVSTGTKKFPTPLGEYQIFQKRLNVRMTWEYGPDNPDNYDLPNVPHVLSFNGSYTLHGTYWHNNFGHRMSHGCVNLSRPNAQWLYNWMDYQDTVIVHP